jgi:hypothetical protein
MAEAGLLTLLAPTARLVAPQATALPALAAYHDLRWLLAYSQSWLSFAFGLVMLLIARSAIDTALLRLAWPHQREAPRLGPVFWSCAAVTLLAWVLLSPAVIVAFGVAVLPFSWPFLAALPTVLGIVLALSHGGALSAWWRRLPPPRTVAWLFASFLVLSTAAAVIAHLGTAAALGVTAAAGIVNARAWYSLAGVAAKSRPVAQALSPTLPGPARLPIPLHGRLASSLVSRSQGRLGGESTVQATPPPVPQQVVTVWRTLARSMRLALRGIPVAPLSALLILVLVVGVARLMFTGTIRLAGPASREEAVVSAAGTGAQGAPSLAAAATAHDATPGAVLVVGGFGSTCCNDAQGLAADDPGMVVRQFSYLGMNAKGQPLPSGSGADDLPIPVLGDRIAAQLMRLHDRTHTPVNIVAESEGTLGVYAMLVRHPRLPVGRLVLLSPIVEPGQLTYPAAGQEGDGAISGYALTELNRLIGRMSPYGSGGAQQLISSVSEFGAQYFTAVSHSRGTRWLAVIPLADAITLPVCELPTGAIVVPAFHGGLLGHQDVEQMVSAFLNGEQVADDPQDEQHLRTAAELLTGAAAAWRMPATHPACP